MIDMVIDLQFGSTGKGLIAGYLAEENKYDTVVTANMPNAGHTYINAAGRTWIHKVLPNGIVSPNLKRVMIGPGAVFAIHQLAKEAKESADLLGEGVKIVIHQAAGILQDRHANAERSMLSGISSTMQGSMAAMVERMQRDPDSNILAKHFAHQIEGALKGFDVRIVDNACWMDHINQSQRILAEGAQGYSLGISSGFWPYCTSRDCTPARFMADMMLPHNRDLYVVGTARTYPIRVGNTADGYSGPCYYDQRETSWEELGVAAERTTVTKRVRRVFTFSLKQVVEACEVTRPDAMFLNFCNYLGNDDEVVSLKDKIEIWTGVPVKYTGWGPSKNDVREGFPL